MNKLKKAIKWSKSLPKISAIDDFIFRSTDKKGHCTSAKASVPPELDRVMNQLVNCGDFPYRTKQDFYRDAFYHRAYQLCAASGMRQEMTALQTLKILEEQLKQEQERSLVENIIRDLEVNMSICADDPEHQRLLIKEIVKQLDGMSSDGLDKYWKDKLDKAVNSKYGHIVKTVRYSMKDRVDEN